MSPKVVGIAAVGTLLAAAGCGGGDPEKGSSDDGPTSNGVEELPGPEIVEASYDAMKFLHDATLEGDATFPLPTGPRSMRARIVATKRGDCELAASSPDAGRLTIRRFRSGTYIRGDDDAWTSGMGVPAGNAALFAGKWVLVPPRSNGFACDLHFLTTGGVERYTCRKGGAVEVGSTPAIEVSCEENGGPVTFSIATVGEPYVLRVDSRADHFVRDLELVSWDDTSAIAEPPRNEVIDTARLG